MHLPLGKPRSWPYASGSDQDSVGRFLGSVQFGIFHGRLSCWEATGDARREFADKLGIEVAEYLDCNSELSESGSYFHMSLYMVGKSPLRAKPTVMFVSGDAKVRKDAFKVIKQSSILAAYPGFALAHIPLETEYRNFRQLAGEGDSTEPSSAATVPARILTTKDGNNSGRRLYFQSFSDGGNGQTCTATAGVLSFQGRPMFLTVCHAASCGPTQSSPEEVISTEKHGRVDEDENSEECGITGFDDLDLGSQEHEDDLVETTSRGSATPESSRSNADDADSVISAVDTVVPDGRPVSIQTRLESPTQIPDLKPLDLTHTETAMPAGDVVLSSSEFDCLLIEVNPVLLPDLVEQDQGEQSHIALEDYSSFVEVEARDAAIRTTTPDGGTIGGTLSGTPSFVRLPFSKKFQQVYTARFNTPLVAGDCGSWVRDTATGKLFGYVIAGSPTTGLVSIMPAHRLFAYLLSELEGLSKASAQSGTGSSQLRGSNNQSNARALSPKRGPGKMSVAGGLRGWRSLFKRLPRGEHIASQPDTPTKRAPATTVAVCPRPLNGIHFNTMITAKQPTSDNTPLTSAHTACTDSVGSKNHGAAQADTGIPLSPPPPNLNLTPMTTDETLKESNEGHHTGYPEPPQFASPSMDLSPESYPSYPRQPYLDYPMSMPYDANGSVYADSPYMYPGRSSPGGYMYADDSSDMRIPSSNLSITTASSSNVGTPLSNNDNLAPIPEWPAGPHSLGVSPSIVYQYDYLPGSEYSFGPGAIEGFNPAFGFAHDASKGPIFVDPSLLHPDVKTIGMHSYEQQHYGDPNSAYPASPTLSASPRLRSGNTSPFIHNSSYQAYSPFQPPLVGQRHQRQPSLVSFHSSYSGDQTYSGDESKEKQRCPHPDCGKVFKDLRAHMLIHQTERPEKCPISTCDYHVKGFARKYDKNRHVLTHYKGTMVCGFCPGSGSAAEKSFNRADVFKRHLTSVHGVEPTPPPNKQKQAGSNVGGDRTKKLAGYPPDATGKCSTCSQTFSNAQDFYEHLDDCVLRIVQQEGPSEFKNDRDVHDTLKSHLPTTTTMTTGVEDDNDMDVDDMADEDLMTSRGVESAISPTNKSQGNPPSGVQKSRGLTHSRGGGPLLTRKQERTRKRERKSRSEYPSSWGFDNGQMNMKKRVMAVFDGPRRLSKDDTVLSTEHEVRVKLPDGKSYITDLDIQNLKRAEGSLDETDEEKGHWIWDKPAENELRKMLEFDTEAIVR